MVVAAYKYFNYLVLARGQVKIEIRRVSLKAVKYLRKKLHHFFEWVLNTLLELV